MAYYAQGGPIPLFHRAEAINTSRQANRVTYPVRTPAGGFTPAQHSRLNTPPGEKSQSRLGRLLCAS
jgi:hypothetical protein